MKLMIMAHAMRFALMGVCSMDDGASMQEEFSLADLADLDVSEIEEIRFEQLPSGVYEWEVLTAVLNEGVNKETQGKQFTAEFTTKVLAVKSVLEANVDKESLVGKQIVTKLYINPAKPAEDVQKAIGRLRAFVTDMGMDSTGKLGDIVSNTVGHIFVGKIVKEKDRVDPTLSYSKLKLDAKKK